MYRISAVWSGLVWSGSPVYTELCKQHSPTYVHTQTCVYEVSTRISHEDKRAQEGQEAKWEPPILRAWLELRGFAPRMEHCRVMNAKGLQNRRARSNGSGNATCAGNSGEKNVRSGHTMGQKQLKRMLQK
jgi:hypothetical protein